MNSRDKGKRGELEWAHFCQEKGWEVQRTAQCCGKTGQAADCIGLPGIHQEVKRNERLNLDEAMEQAMRDSAAAGRGDFPCVMHRRNGKLWKVTMLADDWMKLYEVWEKQYEQSANCKEESK